MVRRGGVARLGLGALSVSVARGVFQAHVARLGSVGNVGLPAGRGCMGVWGRVVPRVALV